MPAWEHIGVLPWAHFTRAENAGLGRIFYPAIGLIALLLTAGTAIAFRSDRIVRLDRTNSRSQGVPIYAAAMLAAAYASVTRAVLVPAMFRLRAAGDDVIELQRIFLIIARWDGINDILHVLTFGLSLWGLFAILSRPTSS